MKTKKIHISQDDSGAWEIKQEERVVLLCATKEIAEICLPHVVENLTGVKPGSRYIEPKFTETELLNVVDAYSEIAHLAEDNDELRKGLESFEKALNRVGYYIENGTLFNPKNK